jgi:hypothetical protein
MPQSVPDVPKLISYGEFGERLFRAAVTEDRILASLGSMAGNRIEFGPVTISPIGLVKISADGQVGGPAIASHEAQHVAFTLRIPVDLRLVIDTGIDKLRFSAEVVANLRLTAHAAEPLLIFIDVAPPRSDDIDVNLHAEGLRASLLQSVAGIDREIKKSVARYIGKELTKPAMIKSRTVDVGKLIGGVSQPGR